MNSYQHPQDEIIARQLAKLSKTRDCICYVEYTQTGDRWDTRLDYDIECSVHFPITSAPTTRKRRT